MNVRFVAVSALWSLGLVGAAAGAYSFHDVFGDDPTYPVEPAQARATLAQTEVPLFVLGEAAARTVGSQHADGSVAWTVVDSESRPMLRFQARTAASGKGTQVHIDVAAPEGSTHDRIAKGLAENPAIARLYEAAMAEQIDAAFNHRKFDFAHISGTMAATTVAMLPKLSQQMSADAAAMRQDEKAQADDAARHQSESAPSRTDDRTSLTAPQVDPDQPR